MTNKKLGEVLFMITNFIKTNSISVIWFIFATLFFVMAWKEWKKSKKDVESLKVIEPQLIGKVMILGIDFAGVIKKFKDELNNSNKESHKIAATSYLFAGFVALISFIISLL